MPCGGALTLVGGALVGKKLGGAARLMGGAARLMGGAARLMGGDFSGGLDALATLPSLAGFSGGAFSRGGGSCDANIGGAFSGGALCGRLSGSRGGAFSGGAFSGGTHCPGAQPAAGSSGGHAGGAFSGARAASGVKSLFSRLVGAGLVRGGSKPEMANRSPLSVWFSEHGTESACRAHAWSEA